ncbi:acyl-CoA dehydrogenase/oxidase C-terminal [Mucor mucedo]|uniref:acyl-CoA dehydrogenase/oxidase C-terminal n=1 Tax=Mucor mucedo TaxID=29922 RepID=UPI00221F5960|nr:acyl-CoA dehydrogenase/oxidase C-terminal [Mucor mucedo]KAI7888616.1 acyl-CoA dehydrogenase/oxidase C-terminal [Mucor mucedo]
MSDNVYLAQMSTDMEEARAKASFPVQSMVYLLRGGKEAYEKSNKIRELAEREPLFDKSRLSFQSRQEQLCTSLLISKRLIEMVEENDMDDEQFIALFRHIELLTPTNTYYVLAFMPVIKAQGTTEQADKWHTAAKRHAIIGCYAQTELSHGSNVMGLNTVAVFDQATDEFVIHSPDITAAKWWIGGLGVACTHAVVQAQLIIAGKSLGPHLFIVPVRSPFDLKPCKGITVGDIGPKAYGGFSTTDNGFALFDHVRIPRDNMLMKFAQVARDGSYTPPVHMKLSYGSMVKLRVDIVTDAAWKLAKASTIAIRYCTVRRQFHNPPSFKLNDNRPESQVISYSSVQHRLMPLLATAYALAVSGESMHQQFGQLMDQLELNNATLLPEVHATSCSLKIWSTRRSSEGIEECRKSMGGHGFSIFSGVSELFANIVPANTYEGDNFVLAQQVARFLLKQLNNVVKGKEITSSTADYLKTLGQGITEPFAFENHNEQILNPQVQLEIFGMRAARLVADLGQQLQAGREWSDLNMECWTLNFAHAEYLILKQMITKVDAMAAVPEHAGLADTMKLLTDLFCLSTLGYSSLATFLSTSTIHPSDLGKLNEQYRQLITRVSNDAIPLTDSFGFSDHELNTALGKKDGRAYEHLWDAVQKNPVNADPENAKLNVRYLFMCKRICH